MSSIPSSGATLASSTTAGIPLPHRMSIKRGEFTKPSSSYSLYTFAIGGGTLKKRFVSAALAAVITITVIPLSGCVVQPSDPSAQISSTPASTSQLVDPLTEITNPKSSVFIAKGITPLIHVSGQGSHVYQITRPTDSSVGIRFFVACTPLGKFVVSMAGPYSGDCTNRFLSSGTFPSSDWGSSSPLRISLQVPSKAHFWLVGIETKGGTN